MDPHQRSLGGVTAFVKSDAALASHLHAEQHRVDAPRSQRRLATVTDPPTPPWYSWNVATMAREPRQHTQLRPTQKRQRGTSGGPQNGALRERPYLFVTARASKPDASACASGTQAPRMPSCRDGLVASGASAEQCGPEAARAPGPQGAAHRNAEWY
jgi:hypothetical protein